MTLPLPLPLPLPSPSNSKECSSHASKTAGYNGVAIQ